MVRIHLVALIALSGLLAPLVARSQAPTDTGPEETLSRGNEAFRAGNFEAALALYSEALTYDDDPTLIYFNMGSSHYRLGQYRLAAQAFEQAAENPRLAAVSFYNLGLVARRENDATAARIWFARARDEATNDALRGRAEAALAVLDGGATPVAAGTPRGEFNTRLYARIGYDDNAFRSPSEPYIDLSQATQPLVTPAVSSGAYIPIRFDADYARVLSDERRILAEYSLRNDAYVDSALEAADRTIHRVAAGGALPLGAGQHTLTAMGVFRRHDETNFDRDDGLERLSSGASIADRYDYASVGVEAALEGEFDRFTYGLDLRIENRDYEDTLVVTEYDHDYASFGGDINFPFSNGSIFSFGYAHYLRDYADRRSRDLLGDSSVNNPTLEYNYDEIELSWTHRFSDSLRGQIRFAHMERTDAYVGYNDYAQDSVRLILAQRFTPRLRARLSVLYHDRSYPRAFAFDEPTAPGKAYDVVEIGALVEYELTSTLSLYAELDAEDVDSSDARGAYDRTRATIGVSWICCEVN